MKFPSLHSWNVSPSEAIKIQNSLRSKISFEWDNLKAEKIAGVDVSFPEKEKAKASVVVLSFPDLRIIERRSEESAATFPYVPGLLAFREAPAILAALSKLKEEPDLFMLDAQGYAHPRRMGLATHLGIILDKPAIGVAKSNLVGSFVAPGKERGAWAPLEDCLPTGRQEIIGKVLRTKEGSPPLFISVGHKITLEKAVEFVLACTKSGQRIPEPTLLAHKFASGGKPLDFP